MHIFNSAPCIRIQDVHHLSETAWVEKKKKTSMEYLQVLPASYDYRQIKNLDGIFFPSSQHLPIDLA